ncbi:hypothetical protein BJX68DRAFT_250187 [Aspergillus pseudodeflectus]|uniref:Uncharacterized protein n=1 Tax=Aspergillus pseudodeflectus TaxID=176178 RepID=A0ABR4JAT7_9EURO
MAGWIAILTPIMPIVSTGLMPMATMMKYIPRTSSHQIRVPVSPRRMCLRKN